MNLKRYSSDYYSHLFYKAGIVTITLLMVIIVYRCSVALHMPTAIDAQRTNTPLDTLINGRALYINNCGSCHTLYLPEKFTSAEWIKNVEKMKNSAKINSYEKEIILKYLMSSSRK